MPGNNSMKKRYKETHTKYIPWYSGCVFSRGNKKLPKSTMILNLTSARNCPARLLGLCTIKPRCYADHSEVRWPCVIKKNLAVEKWLSYATRKEILDMFDAYIYDEEN